MATLNYTAASDFVNVLSETEQAQLTDDSTFGTIDADSDVLEYYLEAAESKVDSYIANRYDVPLTTVPASLKHAVLIVAKYHLFLRREFVKEPIETEYNQIIEWLLLLRNGEVDLPGVDEDDEFEDVQIGFGEVDEMTFDRNIFFNVYDDDD